MITWKDIYKVVAAMVPLFVALFLGYGSIRWWHIFKREHIDAINRLAAYFILPLFVFQFTRKVDPFNINYRFVCADILSKVIMGIGLIIWAKCSHKGSYDWTITCFSLFSLSNALVVGVPLVKAMYDQMAVDLVVQSCVLQSILWFIILLFMLEVRNVNIVYDTANTTHNGSSDHELSNDWGNDIEENQNVEAITNHELSNESGNDREGNKNVEAITLASHEFPLEVKKELKEHTPGRVNKKPSFWVLMKVIVVKLLKNPNCYACVLGLVWAFIGNRFHITLPSIVDGSILILSTSGSGISMFGMGLFMALQEKVFLGGLHAIILGLVMRFVVAPAIMGICSFTLGLRNEVLCVSILQVEFLMITLVILRQAQDLCKEDAKKVSYSQAFTNCHTRIKDAELLKKNEGLKIVLVIEREKWQAALPQAIVAFVFAKEYELHAGLISTMVIFGTFVSLPVLIAYHAVFEAIK